MQPRSIDISSELIAQQQYVRGKLAYQEFRDIRGIDIRGESRRNMKERMAALHQGAAYLEKYAIPGTVRLSDHEQHAYKQIGSHFDPRELVLIDYIERHLTIRHATHALHQMGGTLLPIRTRMGQGKDVNNSHTPLWSAEGSFNFFTLGIDDHKVADFLSHHQPAIITISLRQFFKEAPGLAEWLWVGSHFTDMMRSMHSHPVEFSGTRFSFHFDPEAKRKTYRYVRADGTSFSRTVNFEDEIYQGQQIFLAMALDLILHLRFIGGEFRDYFLNYISHPGFVEKSKVILLQKVMTLLMPPDVTTEAKIPNGIPLKMTCVSISDASENRYRNSYVNSESDDCPLIAVLQDHRLTTEERKWNLASHLARGALPFKRQSIFIDTKMQDVTAVELAIIKGDKEALSLFLGTKIPDALCPHIKYLTTPNRVETLDAVVSRQPDSYVLMQDPAALEKYDEQNWQLFSILLSHGGDIAAMGRHIMMKIAQDNKKIRQYFLDYAHNFNLSCFQQVVLATVLMSHNENAALEKLIITRVIDITAILKTGENVLINNANIFEQEKTQLNYKLGYTLLHLAVILSNVEAVRMLIRLGADINVRADNGMTCVDLADKSYEDLKEELGKNEQALKQQGLVYWREYRRQRAEYNTKLSKNAAIRKVLSVYKMPANSRTAEEKCLYVHTASVAVITGVDKQGQRVVVMGRKKIIQSEMYIQEQSSVTLSGFVLPGGLKDIKDEDFLAAAKREAKEETGLDLNKFIANGMVSPALLHVFRKLSADGKTLHEVHFYHFDLGAHIHERRLYPYDDLVVVNKIPVAAIKKDAALPLHQQYTVMHHHKQIPLLASNGLLIEMLSGHEVKDQLDAALALENDGYGMLCAAASTGNRDRLRYCLEQGNISLDENDQSTTPLIEASKSGQHQIVSELLLRGAKIDNGCNQSDNSPLVVAINAKQMSVIHVLCSHDPSIISYFELYAATKGGDMDIIRYLIRVVCDHPPEKMDVSGRGSVPGKMRMAMECCVKHGLLAEAFIIMPYYVPDSYDQRNKLFADMLKRGYLQLASDFFVSILQKQLDNTTASPCKISINRNGKIIQKIDNDEQLIELSIEKAARIFVGQYNEIPKSLINSIHTVVKFNKQPLMAMFSATGLFSSSVAAHHRAEEANQPEQQCLIM